LADGFGGVAGGGFLGFGLGGVVEMGLDLRKVGGGIDASALEAFSSGGWRGRWSSDATC
jgi:hypothetical protein